MKLLYEHQRRALERLPVDGGYLAFEQGLGKTLTAIRYALENGYVRILVVAPAVALGVWERELKEEGFDALLPTGTRKEKAAQIADTGEIFTVINYEALLDPAVEKAVRAASFDLMVIDEAHKVKTATAKRSKVLHRLGKDVPALLLSGTPITKNLLDLYSQYKIIDPNLWDGVSWTRFKHHYGIWGGYGGYQLIGYNNVEELKDKIAPFTVVARKADTLDLPEKTHTEVPIPLAGKIWIRFSEMAATGVSGEWVTQNPLEQALRLAQIASEAKIDATVEFIKDMQEMGEPVVVYARFLDSLDKIGIRTGVEPLTGSTKQHHRTAMVESFQQGKTDVFLAQITAGSVGITLTRASHMWYHELTFAYEDWAQSQDRIHRIGQYEPVNYYYATAVGPKGGRTIDGLIYDALLRKQDVAAMITANPALLLPEE